MDCFLYVKNSPLLLLNVSIKTLFCVCDISVVIPALPPGIETCPSEQAGIGATVADSLQFTVPVVEALP